MRWTFISFTFVRSFVGHCVQHAATNAMRAVPAIELQGHVYPAYRTTRVTQNCSSAETVSVHHGSMRLCSIIAMAVRPSMMCSVLRSRRANTAERLLKESRV